MQGLLQEFALSSQEGVALMCLAEALLRIPDAATRDALIRDKIAAGNWQPHLGQSPSLFVNAADLGPAAHRQAGRHAQRRRPHRRAARSCARGGEPLIRKGVDMAMRMMGEQFVTGETIEQALANARPREARGLSLLLRHARRGGDDGARRAGLPGRLRAAIHAIGRARARGRGIVDGPGISIKLSALHPRYAAPRSSV